MYLRTVFRSKPVVRAIADTDRPCRCRSNITTNSPRLITEHPLPTIGMSIGEDSPLVFQRAPRKTGDTLRLRKIQTALLGSFAPASTTSGTPTNSGLSTLLDRGHPA